MDQLRNDAASPKTKKGEFSILCEFLPKFDDWIFNALDTSIETDELVMTFSNVNPAVVEINAKAIGIFDFPEFGKIKLGHLNDLVGQRNDIAHGAIIKPPDNDRFKILMKFTDNIVIDYCEVFINWIQSQYDETVDSSEGA